MQLFWEIPNERKEGLLLGIAYDVITIITTLKRNSTISVQCTTNINQSQQNKPSHPVHTRQTFQGQNYWQWLLSRVWIDADLRASVCRMQGSLPLWNFFASWWNSSNLSILSLTSKKFTKTETFLPHVQSLPDSCSFLYLCYRSKLHSG